MLMASASDSGWVRGLFVASEDSATESHCDASQSAISVGRKLERKKSRPSVSTVFIGTASASLSILQSASRHTEKYCERKSPVPQWTARFWSAPVLWRFSFDATTGPGSILALLATAAPNPKRQGTAAVQDASAHGEAFDSSKNLL